jgi:polyhydroxyalkanoate synthesis repressor PhaR
MSEPRLIKKYPNRRLYDTELSRYITIEDVRALIAARTRPRIVEQRSGADITRSVLLQVVAELELGAAARLSEAFLTELIRSYELGNAERTAAALEACMAEQLKAGGAATRGP